MAGDYKPLEKSPASGTGRARMSETALQTRMNQMALSASTSMPSASGGAGPVHTLQRLSGIPAVMRMLDIQRATAGLHEPSDDAIRSAAAEGIRTPSTPLPYLGRIQASFGRHSIAHVRAHVGPGAARATRAMNAAAYTTGRHVVFGPAPGLHTAAHEAAHIIQQRAGVEISGGISRPGDPYERHADAVADAVVAGRSAAELLNSPSEINDGESARETTTGIQTIQRKSMITGISPKKAKDTPLATLHKTFEDYFKTAKLTETYDFHGLQVTYASTNMNTQYVRAGTAKAQIDPKSRSRANGSNRNSAVITPYGHIGRMERAIFARENLGNTYDGGHLIEHTLMEGTDADIEGNLAPQNSTEFNQGLMRGWEHVPEHYRDNGIPFDYSVKVSYPESTYSRTGADLLVAGVISDNVFKKLPQTEQQRLKQTKVTFERWIPHHWEATVAASNTLSSFTIPKGTHYKHLKSTQMDAENSVFDPAVNNLSIGLLKRSNSGEFGGYIDTAKVPQQLNTGVSSRQNRMGGGQQSTISFSGNQNNVITAHMFQSYPQDPADQPSYKLNPNAYGNNAPAPLTTYVPKPKLPTKLDVQALGEEVYSVSSNLLASSKKISKPSNSTTKPSKRTTKPPKKSAILKKLDTELNRLNKEYSKVRSVYLRNHERGGIFIEQVHNARAKGVQLDTNDLAAILIETSSRMTTNAYRNLILELQYET